MDSNKKISFGFSKLTKKPNLIINKSNEKKPEEEIQLIQCLEGNSIKLVKEHLPELPLVIPVQKNRTSTALASLRLRQAVLNGSLGNEENLENPQIEINNKITNNSVNNLEENESLEKKAARELLEEINKNKSNENDNNVKIEVPLNPDELPLEGAEEPSIEDYEKIPISKFGLAMLRGMGWKDEENKKKKIDDEPFIRPKGMGLGADKVIKPKPLLVPPEENEKLIIKKNSYVRILGGKYNNLYGQIEGLDDHSGRVVVKLALGGIRESLNEFLVQPVSKGEYTKYSKVINSTKYEEYKKMQDKQDKLKIKSETDIKSESNKKKEKIDKIKSENDKIKTEENIKQEKCDKYNREPSCSSNNYNNSKNDFNDNKKKSKHEYSQYYDKVRETQRYNRNERREKNESSSENSSDYYRSKKKSKNRKHRSKSRNRRYSDSEDEKDKRHKKKTKKSKKPRSRSRGRK